MKNINICLTDYISDSQIYRGKDSMSGRISLESLEVLPSLNLFGKDAMPATINLRVDKNEDTNMEKGGKFSQEKILILAYLRKNK